MSNSGDQSCEQALTQVRNRHQTDKTMTSIVQTQAETIVALEQSLAALEATVKTLRQICTDYAEYVPVVDVRPSAPPLRWSQTRRLWASSRPRSSAVVEQS